jgi:hypothetical protein
MHCPSLHVYVFIGRVRCIMAILSLLRHDTLLQLLMFCLNPKACLYTHAFLQVLLLYGLVCFRLDHADSAEWLHRARDQFQSESSAAAGTGLLWSEMSQQSPQTNG